MASPFLAVDWGTTNLRAWVVGADGRAGVRHDFPLGVGRLAAGEAAQRFADTVRPKMGAASLPTLMCGMIGSNLGWQSTPYLDCPAGIAQLHDGLARAEAAGPPIWIVPGLRCERPDGGPDVMRGEETHVLGWATEDPGRLQGEHLICHPGTHAKWVRLVDGRVERFVSSMTGELFDVLRRHSVLKGGGPDTDEAAFDEGLAAAGDGGALASRLFTARARVVGGGMAPERMSSYLSGLLIGAEVAATPGLLAMGPKAPVAVIGDLRLAGRYLRALRALGYTAEVHDGEGAALAGLTALAGGAMAQDTAAE